MKYLKHFDLFNEQGNYPMDCYPGPNLTNSTSNFLTAGASDGQIGSNGWESSMGGEFPKRHTPSTPYPDKFKQTIKNVASKESKKRKNALQKLQKLDKLLKFDEFNK